MQPQAVMAWYQEALDYSMPFRPKELKAAAWLLHEGYTLQEIQGCYKYWKEKPWYTDKHLSLTKVQEEIGAWKQSAEKQKPTERTIKTPRKAGTVRGPEPNHLEEYRQLRGRLPWETLDQETGEIR